MSVKKDTTPPDIDALIEQCRSEDPKDQLLAMLELGKAGARRAVPAILPLVSAGHKAVRGLAADTLGDLGHDYIDQVGPALEALLTDPEWGCRDASAGALGRLKYAPARPALEHAMLNDLLGQIRSTAADALGDIGDPAALDALIAALVDDFFPTRASAAYAIGRLGDETHIPSIRKALFAEFHPRPHGELAATAMRLGDDSAFDELIKLLRKVRGDFTGDVLDTIDTLLYERTPLVVLTRAEELDQALLELGERTQFDGYAASLRMHLADLSGPTPTGGRFLA